MADLSPQEQAFFESGGDTSHLAPEQLTPIDTAGLSVGTPIPEAPAAPAPLATPEPQPQFDQTAELLRRSLDESRQTAANLQAQLEQLQKPQTPPPAIPDPNTDPLGNMLHQLDQVNKNVADLQAKLLGQQQQNDQAQAFNNFKNQVLQLRDEFIKTTPDFQTAYEHLRSTRMADLRQMGVPEADIEKTVFQEEFNLSQRAIGQAKNPASEMYEMAKRHGYVKQGSTAVKLDAVKAGQAASPPSLPKTHVNEDISVDSLREASNDDLNKIVSDPNSWAKIAGKDHIPL